MVVFLILWLQSLVICAQALEAPLGSISVIWNNVLLGHERRLGSTVWVWILSSHFVWSWMDGCLSVNTCERGFTGTEAEYWKKTMFTLTHRCWGVGSIWSMSARSDGGTEKSNIQSASFQLSPELLTAPDRVKVCRGNWEGKKERTKNNHEN